MVSLPPGRDSSHFFQTIFNLLQTFVYFVLTTGYEESSMRVCVIGSGNQLCLFVLYSLLDPILLCGAPSTWAPCLSWTISCLNSTSYSLRDRVIITGQPAFSTTSSFSPNEHFLHSRRPRPFSF